MDAKELQIGDWVRLVADGDNEILQVTYVREDGVGFKKYAVYFDEVEPIQLTAEILELNGFKNIEEVSVYQVDGVIGDGIWQNDQLFCGIDNTKGKFLFYTFSIDPDDDGLINKIENITCVHELQRALRCCGLWNLANNFKII